MIKHLHCNDFQIFLILFLRPERSAPSVASLRNGCHLPNSTEVQPFTWKRIGYAEIGFKLASCLVHPSAHLTFYESLLAYLGYLARFHSHLVAQQPALVVGFCQASKPSTTMMASTVPDKALASTGSGQVEIMGLRRKKLIFKSSTCWNNYLTPRCLFGG